MRTKNLLLLVLSSDDLNDFITVYYHDGIKSKQIEQKSFNTFDYDINLRDEAGLMLKKCIGFTESAIIYVNF